MYYLRPSFRLYLVLYPLLYTIILAISSIEVFAKTNEVETGERNNICKELILPPASGKKPDSIVVLFHGYGDVAENFLFLSAFWAELLPNTIFIAFEGPKSCKDMPGKKWVNATSKNPGQLLKEINVLTQSLNRQIDGLLKKYNISSDKLVLVGFSQGARVAIHLGLRRPCAGVVGFSGAFLDDPTTKLQSPLPPILLIHGLEDQKLSSSVGRESHKRLEALRVPTTLFLMPGVGHTIDPRGSQIAGEFINDCFSGNIMS